MPEQTAIDRMYDEAVALIRVLQKSSEVSLQISASDHLRKALLLAVASHFESRMCSVVLEFVRERAGGSSLVESFVRNKAIGRQYHTWFQWEKNNANQFFSLFGDKFKAAMIGAVDKSEDMRSSVRAFLELGNERNRLVHQDYATFQMEKTLEEIYALYQNASKFVAALPLALRDCDGT
jgi:RiboL-PSP-HEPN